MSHHAKHVFPFSKIAHVATDLAGPLADAATVADAYPDLLAGQHAIRRWEYCMALETIWDWQRRREGLQDPLQICDVGGAGSNFWQLLTQVTSEDILIVDANAAPVDPPGQRRVYPGDLQTYAATAAHAQFDILTCISVIEHIKQPDLRRFLRAAHMLLKPGGLLFLTTDCWDADGPDCAHFHWMRERIYNPETLKIFMTRARELGFGSYEAADWTYQGDQLYNYSVASIALVRR